MIDILAIHLRLENGDVITYDARTITDPADGIEKVKLADHFDNIRDKVLAHLSDNSNAIRIIHPNEDEELLSFYLHKMENDPVFQAKISMVNLLEKEDEKEKEVKDKLSDKTSLLYFLTHEDFCLQKFYTQDITLDIVAENSQSIFKDIFDRYNVRKKM